MKTIWLFIFFSVLTWSAIHPKDYFTWVLEVFPAIAGIVVLAITYKRFRLTQLAYILILIHSIILMVGGHYTYAEEPLFNWIRDNFHFVRNNYDKIGHIAQGFVPAIIIREIIIRKSVVAKPKWQNFFVVSICLALSAVYEFIEWWISLLTGESADAFLGTQGYVWDTQSDMFLALIGALLSLAFLSKLHDKQLKDYIKHTGKN